MKKCLCVIGGNQIFDLPWFFFKPFKIKTFFFIFFAGVFKGEFQDFQNFQGNSRKKRRKK